MSGCHMMNGKVNNNKYDRNVFRKRHVEEYVSLFYPELKKRLKDCDVLDLGCARGVLSIPLAPYVRKVKGIDIRGHCIEVAKKIAKEQKIKNVDFKIQSIFDLDSKRKYDIILLSDVLEHVKNQKQLLEKSLNLLRHEGILYINTPNKWFPIEAHRHLIFLGYLPSDMANRYSQKILNKDYKNFYLLSYSEFLNLLNSFRVKYHFKTFPHPTRVLYKAGKPFVDGLPFLWRFANAFQVIVQKGNN